MTFRCIRPIALTALLALGAASAIPARAAAKAMPPGVAWTSLSAPADVDRAFAAARTSGKPLLMYWGATWCPPCNQLKATLFNRQDFAALARSYQMVHVDGDRPGAQRVGQRFSVSGYPTLVVFRPDGQEMTRLPGEATPEQVMELLQAGLAGGRPVAALLADARSGRTLTQAEWRSLAFYSWDTDDDRLLGNASAAGVLAELAPLGTRAGVTEDVSARLWLRALAASDDGKGVRSDDAVRERVRQLLFEPARARAVADVLVNRAADILKALGDTPELRQPFAQPLDALLRQFQSDPTLSRPDRMSALVSRVLVARIEQPKGELRPSLPPELLKDVRAHAAQADREVTDAYERMATIPAAAYALERAGLWTEAQTLLSTNVARSHAPYYLMSQLGSLHRKQGHTAEALRWYGRAYEASRGPATRLQWGASYVQALVDLSPRDAKRIEATVNRLLDEAGQDPGAFHKRSARSLQRVGRAVQKWAQEGGREPSLTRLRARLDGVCAQVDPADGARDRCKAVLSGGPAA